MQYKWKADLEVLAHAHVWVRMFVWIWVSWAPLRLGRFASCSALKNLQILGQGAENLQILGSKIGVVQVGHESRNYDLSEKKSLLEHYVLRGEMFLLWWRISNWRMESAVVSTQLLRGKTVPQRSIVCGHKWSELWRNEVRVIMSTCLRLHMKDQAILSGTKGQCQVVFENIRETTQWTNTWHNEHVLVTSK
jgi:hypothetical protein